MLAMLGLVGCRHTRVKRRGSGDLIHNILIPKRSFRVNSLYHIDNVTLKQLIKFSIQREPRPQYSTAPLQISKFEIVSYILHP